MQGCRLAIHVFTIGISIGVHLDAGVDAAVAVGHEIMAGHIAARHNGHIPGLGAISSGTPAVR